MAGLPLRTHTSGRRRTGLARACRERMRFPGQRLIWLYSAVRGIDREHGKSMCRPGCGAATFRLTSLVQASFATQRPASILRRSTTPRE